MKNIQDQFLAWLAKRVSASKLSDYYLLIPDIDAFAKNNRIYTGTLFDVLDKSIVLNLIGYLGKKRQNKSMTDLAVLYHKYLVETPSASSNQKKPAVITSSPQKTSQPSKPKITSDTDAFSIPESVLSKKQPPEAMKRFSVNSSGELCASGSEISSVEEISRTESRKDNAKQKSVEGKEKPAENSGATDSEGKIVDFYHKQSYAFTKPVSVSYFGKLFYESSWRTLYKKLCKLLAFYYPDVFKRLRNQSKSGNREYMVYDSEIAKNLTKPFEVAKGIFVETNRSATDLMESIRKLLNACAVDYENVEIRYIQKPQTSSDEEAIASNATRNNNDSHVPKAAEHTKTKAEQMRQEFIEWLKTQKYSQQSCESAANAVQKSSDFALFHRVTDTPFFEVSDYDTFADISIHLNAMDEFRLFNNGHHNFFSLNVKGYLKFLKAYCSKKLETTEQVEEHQTQEKVIESTEDDTVENTSMESDVTGIDEDDIAESKEEAISIELQEYIVDFLFNNDYAFTTPVYVKYFGRTIYESSWVALYKKICKLLVTDYPNSFDRIKQRLLSGDKSIHVYDSRDAIKLIRPYQIADGLYIETNRNANELLDSLHRLLDACQVDYRNIEIHYTQKVQNVTHEENETATVKPIEQSEREVPEVRSELDLSSKAEQTRQAFIAWMQKNGYSQSSCNGYASALLTISQFAKDKGVATRSFFEMTDPNESAGVWRKLRLSPEFIKYNRDKHNQFSAAIRQFITFHSVYNNSSTVSNTNPSPFDPKKSKSDQSKPSVFQEKKPVRLVSPPSVATTTQAPVTHFFDGLLQDARYDELRKALIAEGITSLDGLKNINLWAFMNSHNLYSIKERLSVSSELTQYLKQGLEKNASENKKYTVQYNDASFSGNTPSEAFLSFLTAIAIKYPLKFRGLISVIHPETNKIVIRKHAYDKRSKLRMMNPQVYIDSDLSCDEVKLYVAWVLQRCSASPAQFNFYDTKQKSEHLVTVPTDIESDVPVQEAPESTKSEVPAHTESPSSPQKDISPEFPEKAGEGATVPDEAGGQPKVFPTPPPRNTQRAEEFLLSCDLEGATINKLQLALSLTMVGTKEAISCSPHIMELDHCFYHDEAFVDFEEASDKIEDILDKLLKKSNGITTAAQLYEYAKSNLSMFLNENAISGQQAIYDLAKFLFDKVEYHGKRYYFRNNIYISLPEVSADSIISIIQKYAREKGTTVTFSEIESYIKGLGLNGGNLRGLMRIDKEPIFLIYQENEYLLAELMHMDSEFFDKVKKVLARLFADVGDHIILRRIAENWYNLLPALPSSLDWTPMLLQHLLRFYSKELGARTIIAMASQSSNTLHAMLVANDSDIEDFRDAVAVFLYEEHPERTSFEAEELRKLLVRAGMLYGNELIGNMHNALKGDPRFLWNSDGSKVTVRLK